MPLPLNPFPLGREVIYMGVHFTWNILMSANKPFYSFFFFGGVNLAKRPLWIMELIIYIFDNIEKLIVLFHKECVSSSILEYVTFVYDLHIKALELRR